VSSGAGEVVSRGVPAAWSSCFRGGVERCAAGLVSKVDGVVSSGVGVCSGVVSSVAGGVVSRGNGVGGSRDVPAGWCRGLFWRGYVERCRHIQHRLVHIYIQGRVK